MILGSKVAGGMECLHGGESDIEILCRRSVMRSSESRESKVGNSWRGGETIRCDGDGCFR